MSDILSYVIQYNDIQFKLFELVLVLVPSHNSFVLGNVHFTDLLPALAHERPSKHSELASMRSYLQILASIKLCNIAHWPEIGSVGTSSRSLQGKHLSFKNSIERSFLVKRFVAAVSVSTVILLQLFACFKMHSCLNAVCG